MPTVDEIEHHFKRKVIVNEDGCWLWQGAVDPRGYARYGYALVYGIVWSMAGNTCEPGFELCHRCKPKNCINPDHLYKGTHSQNIQDSVRAMSGPRKMTDKNYQQMRDLKAKGVSQAQIARELKISPSLVCNFFKGKLKHAHP